MPQYLGQSQFDHASAQRLGVLLVNLGTPDAPTPAAVRRFLAEFLWDPRVIETPRWIWWLALHGVILRIRPRRSAHAYRQIWTPEGSPLLVHCRQLAAKLQAAIDVRVGPDVQVALGMSYGNPSIPAALEQLHRSGMRRLVVLPLYPQYSGTTTASVFDRVTTVLQRWRWLPETRFIGGYHDEPGYIAAVAASIREHWRTQERRHLLFSFHGAPRAYLDAGDPYHCQCLKTARLIAENLGLEASEWTATFQSRLGRGEWLRPYTDETLKKFAATGPRRITIVCPGFPTDNLETLEENAIRNRADFLAAGGAAFDYIAALNASDAHAAFLADLVARHAQGWPETSGGLVVDADTQARARRAGAVR